MNRTIVIAILAIALTDSLRSQTVELHSPTDEEGAYFGASVLGITDLTGDGIGELAVGAFYYSYDDAYNGSVFLLNGKDFSLVSRIDAPNPGGTGDSAHFGWSLATTTDVNRDGTPELVVGAIYAERPDLRDAGFGEAYIIDPKTGLNLQTLAAPRPRRNTRFGWNVASVPSTKDGQVARIAVGAPTGLTGQVHLYDSTTGELILSKQAPVARSGDWFGASVAAIADANGDGRVDLAVGAGGEDNGVNSSAGAAYLLSGETGAMLHQFIPPDLPAITRHRWAVAAAPDMNGDGVADVLVGVPMASAAGSPSLAGRAYVFSAADGTLLRTLTSPAPMARGFFGWSVAGLPDITGDGIGEVLIGAGARPSVGSFGERRIHVMNGATGQTIETFKSLSNGESFGFCVTGLLNSAGKLRAVVSGAATETPPNVGDRAGRAYAFPLGLSFVAATMTAEGTRLSVTSTDDAPHELQGSTDLSNWTILKAINSNEVYLETTVTEKPVLRFYRAKRLKP